EIYKNNTFSDIALIDAVVMNETHTASRAIWKSNNMSQVFLTTCDTSYLGLSSIGGQVARIGKEESKGIAIDIDHNNEMFKAPIIPGVFVPIGIKKHTIMLMNEFHSITQVPSVIAVDGEKEVEIFEDETVTIKLTWNGPRLINIPRILQFIREEKIFYM